MIIIASVGGLGNQMFSYAFYLSMKRKYKASNVKMDLCYPGLKDHNGYELEKIFGIKVQQASGEEVLSLADVCPDNIRFSKLMRRLIKMKVLLCGYKESFWIQNDSTRYYESIYDLNPFKSYYLLGTWGNEKYFKDFSDEIKSQFKFREELSGINLEIQKEMQACESVSIHFRRGDFISVGANLISNEYYYKAIEYMESCLGACTFYVFSDDIDYAKSVLGEAEKFKYVNWNIGKDSYKDMQLMSKCKHNIIANSTFSFWGAYLNENPEKIVIATTVAFSKDSACNFSAEGWINMDNEGKIQKPN